MSVELVFDTSAEGSDVRKNTEKVAFFIMAPRDKSNKPVQPGLSFEWAALSFAAS